MVTKVITKSCARMGAESLGDCLGELFPRPSIKIIVERRWEWDNVLGNWDWSLTGIGKMSRKD